MKNLKKIIVLLLNLLWLCIGQGCTPEENTLPPTPITASVLIDSTFTSKTINTHVLVATKLSSKDLARKDLKEWVTKNKITVLQKQTEVTLGPYRQYPEAWFYTQLINNDNQSKQLVIDEFAHIRCDAFEVFTTKNGTVKQWGSINRLTPFADYPIPFFTYAIPININPKDTLNLLIHTKRSYGRHQVNLGVSVYSKYIEEHIFHFLSKIFQVIIFVICILAMFVLGRVFSYKTMTYLGYYLSSLLFMHLASWGFTDSLMAFSGIGLSANNVATTTIFISSVCVQPFLMDLMKVVPKNERFFKGVSYFLVGINLFATCCYFVPASIFPQIDAFFFLPQMVLVLALVTVLWLFYCSFLALFSAKIYYMLIGFGMAFLPFFMQQLSGAFSKSSPFLIQVSHPTFVLAAIGLSIISIYLLQEQLVSRKKLKEDLHQLRTTMDDIRRNEIEVIGRNLHDNVGNMLASVLGYIDMKNQKPEVIKNLLTDSINEVRFLSHTLVKQEDQPITEKLEMLASRFNDFSSINLYYNDLSLGKLNKIELLRQQNLYMIIQEILTNIIKHSKATEAHIQIFENEGTFQVTIEDDGIGIASGSLSDGIGMKNIYKRGELSSFKITLDSNPTGTNFIIEVPETHTPYGR